MQMHEAKAKSVRRREDPPPVDTREQMERTVAKGEALKRKADAIERMVDEALAGYERSGFGLAQHYVQRGGE